MLVICSNCEARLQLDESKIPPKAFKVRCPKCQSSIDIKFPGSAAEAANEKATSLPPDMTPPSPSVSLFERPAVAAPFKTDDTATDPKPDAKLDSNEVVRFLVQALRQDEGHSLKSAAGKRPSWERRKALVCSNENISEIVASALVAQDYEVFVAESTAEALGRMREDRIDVLILDPNFDPVEQGYAFVTREVKLMRPSERRRLFLVYLTPTARTMDLHAAFLNNVNLVVNPADLDRLPEALEISIVHYNKLYRDFYLALEVPAI